ncbi:hypothetical protein AK812_SmicGene26509 [Symbiodinium microadriaticum]|uniref:EF-hand domain-containing protein n=1 Tax=Symbiodinium microadriaticum TaxID=2951 RepID=A0A1Q9D9E1_SYMMI|nr:hypothetical protein AK812_SmicGene26509 [Symbiodinium microadriaticum]CAE7306537.1 unnamed protein product [Symbiodinium microadriaticum]CAE7900305.1 unnamed protein product [Symbiodinium sp. KB8]
MTESLAAVRRKSALLEEQSQELRRAKERHALISTLTDKGGGYFLVGWRRELDPDGSMDVELKELDWHLRRLGLLELSARNIVGPSAESLTLEDLSKKDGDLVRRVREWIKEKFGSPADVWNVIDAKQTGSLDRAGWTSSCLAAGFDGTVEELHYLFQFVDIDEGGSINKEEILFLETDSQARDKAIFEEKMKSKGQVERLWASVYWSELHKGHSPLSRTAPRPWMAKAFEALPPLVIVQRQHRLREARRTQRQSKSKFLKFLCEKYGSCARAWRRGIDPDGHFFADKLILRHFCRQHELDYQVHMPSLWTTLDSDSDGKISLQDISPLGAVALASFRAWCRKKCGSCRAVWSLPEMEKARASPQLSGDSRLISVKKMLIGHFVESLKALGWICSGDQAEMLSALDFFNAGFVSQADLYWLDTWEPPLFLISEPSEEAWNEVKHILLDRYGSPLHAWRELDLDGQNEVSWTEFVAGCRRVRFKGDVGAAWRFIDNDASGYISMEEFSPDIYNVLMSFKQWASRLYGSVGNAFKNFDKEGNGTLTLHILRRCCQKGKWSGDAQELFQCVGPTSSRQDPSKKLITVEDVAFLDLWPDREKDDKVEDEESPSCRSPSPKSDAHPRLFKKPAPQAPTSTARSTPKLARPETTSSLRKEHSAELAASSPQKAAQIQRTYCCRSLQRRGHQHRHQKHAAKSKLPWLDKLHRLCREAPIAFEATKDRGDVSAEVPIGHFDTT